MSPHPHRSLLLNGAKLTPGWLLLGKVRLSESANKPVLGEPCPEVPGRWRAASSGGKGQRGRIAELTSQVKSLRRTGVGVPALQSWLPQVGLSVRLLLLVQVLGGCVSGGRELNWNLRPVVTTSVCYCSGDLEFSVGCQAAVKFLMLLGPCFRKTTRCALRTEGGRRPAHASIPECWCWLLARVPTCPRVPRLQGGPVPWLLQHLSTWCLFVV